MAKKDKNKISNFVIFWNFKLFNTKFKKIEIKTRELIILLKLYLYNLTTL